MADLKTTELDALAIRADADLIMVVDTSDTSMAASGTNKYMTTANFLDGISGTPGGADTQIQFNADGSFGGDANLTWDDTNHVITVGASSGGGILVQGTYNSGWTIPNATGTRMFFNPRKAAFRAGYTSSKRWDAVNVGVYSIAFGYNTKASGHSSTAFGSDTIASGTHSTAFGYYTTASCIYSTAFGTNTRAGGTYSTAFGYNTNANGANSTAFGINTTASGANSIALGFRTIANGNYSTANGHESYAYAHGQKVFAMGAFDSIGDAQTSQYVISVETTSTSKTELLNLNDVFYRIKLLENRTYTFSIFITARDGDTPKSAGYKIEGVCANDSGVGAIIGSTVTQLSGANTLGTVEVDIDSDATYVYFVINVTPNTTNTIRWVAAVTFVEVKNAGGYYY